MAYLTLNGSKGRHNKTLNRLTFRAEEMAGSKQVAAALRRKVTEECANISLCGRSGQKMRFSSAQYRELEKIPPLVCSAGMKRSCGGKSGTDGLKLSTFQRRILLVTKVWRVAAGHKAAVTFSAARIYIIRVLHWPL